MPKAVRYDHFGGIEVLQVVDVEKPMPGSGQVLVNVKAAGINPGEAAIRSGALAKMWPSTFPSGQGSDLAGVIASVGNEVQGFKEGDEVIGFTNNRASQAEFVVVGAKDLIKRPSEVSWEAAGGLFVAGVTAYAAVRAVSLKPSDTVVISGAAGGVGTIAVQLAVETGAKVFALASEENFQWLRDHGATPLTYDGNVEQRIREATNNHVDAFIDTFGSGYVDLAIKLGVKPERIDTIADFEAGSKYGVKTDGNAAGASAEVMDELVQRIAQGKLEVPIAHTYPLAQVQDAYRELEQRHTRGKIVLLP